MCFDTSMCIDWSIVANVLVALATVSLACLTYKLASATKVMAEATKNMVNESKAGNLRQIGVQTWLTLEEKFESKSMLILRSKIALQIQRYNNDIDHLMGDLHNTITDDVFNIFESIGKLYSEDYIDKKLAECSFGYYAVGWWKLAKKYIENERENKKDSDIFKEFEKFAEEMVKYNKDTDFNSFANDEVDISRNCVKK